MAKGQGQNAVEQAMQRVGRVAPVPDVMPQVAATLAASILVRRGAAGMEARAIEEAVGLYRSVLEALRRNPGDQSTPPEPGAE